MIPPEEPYLSLLYFLPCSLFHLPSPHFPPPPPAYVSSFSSLATHPVVPLLLPLPARLPPVYHMPSAGSS